MPVKRCQSDGKSGWKYGDSGHCYTGPGAKKKAVKQGQAIEIQRHIETKSNLFNAVIACLEEKMIDEDSCDSSD